MSVLPITIHCLKAKNHVDHRVVNFVASLGATINMDGAAIFNAVSLIFIAQLNNIPLDIGQVIIVR